MTKDEFNIWVGFAIQKSLPNPASKMRAEAKEIAAFDQKAADLLFKCADAIEKAALTAKELQVHLANRLEQN